MYDARRRIAKTTYDDGTTTVYAYDGPGNLAGVTDQAGNAVQYTYDAANQLQSVVQVNHPDPVHNTTAAGFRRRPLGRVDKRPSLPEIRPPFYLERMLVDDTNFRRLRRRFARDHALQEASVREDRRSVQILQLGVVTGAELLGMGKEY